MSKPNAAAKFTSESSDVRFFGLLSREAGERTQDVGDAPASNAFNVDWEAHRVEPFFPKPELVKRLIQTQGVPLYVHDFATRVSAIKNVCRVIGETGEDGMSVHITTFAKALTDDIRNQVYAIEADTIKRNPHVHFDFHLRGEEKKSGDVNPVTARYYYTVWGFSNADEGGVPDTSG